jgi:hypothetical protein
VPLGDRPVDGDVPDRPVAREGAFQSVEVGDELVLLDESGELPLYHNLNRLAVDIWQGCNGRPLAEIARETRIPLDAVRLGVAELSDAGLLTQSQPLSMSRRNWLRAAAIAAGLVVLPTVASVTAPDVQAGSRANGTPCSQDTDCVNFCCVAGTCGDHAWQGWGGTCDANCQCGIGCCLLDGEGQPLGCGNANWLSTFCMP